MKLDSYQLLRKNFLFIIALLLCFDGMVAQTVDKFYVDMPDALNPTLSKQNRMELLEYHKAASGDSIANRFGNMAYLLSHDTISNYLMVKNTPNSTFEMFVMAVNDSVQSIGIIRTVCGPICQSSIEFYDTAWHQIPLQFIAPKAVDWLIEGSYSATAIDKDWLKNVLQTSFISFSFEKTKRQIIVKNNSLEFLSEIDKKLISPFVSNKVMVYRLESVNWILEP